MHSDILWMREEGKTYLQYIHKHNNNYYDSMISNTDTGMYSYEFSGQIMRVIIK